MPYGRWHETVADSGSPVLRLGQNVLFMKTVFSRFVLGKKAVKFAR